MDRRRALDRRPLGRPVTSVMEAFGVLTHATPDRRGGALVHRRWAAATGIEPLDRLLGGGLAGPGVTTLEADRPAQALAIAHTIARDAVYPVLVACSDPAETLAGVLAGRIDVPLAAVLDDSLDVDEFDALCDANTELAAQNLEFTDTDHLGDLAHAVRGHARVVIVLEPERFGPSTDTVDHLIAMAARTDAAVLHVGEAEDLAPGTEAAIVRVVSTGVSHTDALLVRTDVDAMLRHAEVRTDCFRSLAH